MGQTMSRMEVEIPHRIRNKKRRLNDIFDSHSYSHSISIKRARFDSICLKITIKMGNISKCIHLNDVNPDWTINELSNALCNVERINPSKTTIVYSFLFHSLSDSLRVCGISNGRNLCVALKFNDNQYLHRYAASIKEWMLFIRTLTGKNVWIRCKESDKISTIKEHIFECEGNPIHQQRLLHNGQTLNDDKTLKHYNVKNRDTLNLVL